MDAAAPSARTVEPPPSRRIVWAIAAMGGGIVSAAFIGASVVSAGGWEFDVSAAIGSEFGRTARQIGEAASLDDNRVPLGLAVLLNVPLWAWFVGVPLRKRLDGLDWRRHLGWTMKPIDVPLGLGLGVLAQIVVLPVLYLPILDHVDGQELEEPARNLVASAGSPLDVVALVL